MGYVPEATGSWLAFLCFARLTPYHSPSFQRASWTANASCWFKTLHKGYMESAPSFMNSFQWKVKRERKHWPDYAFCSTFLFYTQEDGGNGKPPSETVVLLICNPSTWEATAGGLVWVWGQPWLQSETLSQKSKQNRTVFGNQQSLASYQPTEQSWLVTSLKKLIEFCKMNE